MRILVTGGAGLVGSHTAEYYAKRGHEVIAFDNLMRSKLFGSDKKTVEYNWKYLETFKNVSRVVGDVRNEEDLIKVIKGLDVVIHTAGQPGVPSSARMPKEDFSINAFGTLNVLECLRQHSPKAIFIYCSTNKVYGENVDRYALNEKDKRYVYKDISGISESLPIDHTAHTPYGVSKYVGDLYTQEYAHIYGMRTAVFRMSCIYGTRQFGFEDQGWVAWFVIAGLLNQPITIYGDGKQVRDLLYVDDLIEGYDAFVKSNLKHAVFNIGGGPNNTTSLLEFLDLLQKETGTRMKISFSDWRPSDQKVYISNIAKVKDGLNWQPKVSVSDGVKRLIKWAKENKSLF
jgi:CDP-paratose 2-epimerase